MIKLLFAEDERATREGVLENIDWKALKIGEIRAEKNGLLALETAKEFMPDILLTDIKMPKMNGLDLARAVKALNPDCSILIISSYSEVDYLKSAIQLGAVDYVDKPLKLDQLALLISKAVKLQEGIRSAAEIRRFAQVVQDQDFDEAVRIIRSVTDFYELDPDCTLKQVADVYFTFLVQVLRYQFGSTEIIQYDSIWRKLSECQAVGDAAAFLIEHIQEMQARLQRHTAESQDPLVEDILAIIHADYADKDLSLDEISRRVYLSASYICVRFKKHTQTTLVQYIQDYRIQQSLPLLLDPNKKLDDIADCVGIDGGNYYSKTFKKIMGISPAEYRTKKP